MIASVPKTIPHLFAVPSLPPDAIHLSHTLFARSFLRFYLCTLLFHDIQSTLSSRLLCISLCCRGSAVGAGSVDIIKQTKKSCVSSFSPDCSHLAMRIPVSSQQSLRRAPNGDEAPRPRQASSVMSQKRWSEKVVGLFFTLQNGFDPPGHLSDLL